MIEGAGTTPSGGASPPRPGPRRESPLDRLERLETRAKPRPQPGNAQYAARRMLVSTIGVTVLVALAVFGWRALRDDGDAPSTDLGAWREIVAVDRASGATALLDRGGSTIATAPGTGRVAAVHTFGDRVALVQSGQVTLTDVDGVAPTIVPVAATAQVQRLPIADRLWLAVSDPNGGNLLLIDAVDGATFDIGALAGQTEPRFFVDTLRFNSIGTLFAVADAKVFQTIVVRTDVEPPIATFFADTPVAISDERLVTSEVVGAQAGVTLSDLDGAALANVTGELPAGGTIADDTVTLISIDGAITRFGKGSTTAERLSAVAVPAGSSIRALRPALDGRRQVVIGDVFEAVLDDDGTTLFTTSFAAPITPPAIHPQWRCLAVGGGDTFHSLIDLDEGTQLADLAGFVVTGISADGCTVIGTRSGVTEVIGRDGSVQLGALRSAELAPDGRAVITQPTSGGASLIEIDEQWNLAPPIDLSAVVTGNVTLAFR